MGQWAPSSELVDIQNTYLGVMAGQRDYTDLNSWIIVAMSREWVGINVDLVAKQYCSWAGGQELPMPGSFALFKRKSEPFKSDYLEYI